MDDLKSLFKKKNSFEINERKGKIFFLSLGISYKFLESLLLAFLIAFLLPLPYAFRSS